MPVAFLYNEMAHPTSQIINGNNRCLSNSAGNCTRVPSFLPVIRVTLILILLSKPTGLSLLSADGIFQLCLLAEVLKTRM